MKINVKPAKILAVFILFILTIFHNVSFAETGSISGWQNWTPVITPGVKMGYIPDCSADVSHLPDIYQDMIATYCSVKPEGPGKFRVLVKPSMIESFKAKNGQFEDGYNLILHLMDLKVLFVTSHLNGKPNYNVFLEDGTKITKEAGPLSAKTCSECHSGFKTFCIAGQCGKFLKSE